MLARGDALLAPEVTRRVIERFGARRDVGGRTATTASPSAARARPHRARDARCCVLLAGGARTPRSPPSCSSARRPSRRTCRSVLMKLGATRSDPGRGLRLRARRRGAVALTSAGRGSSEDPPRGRSAAVGHCVAWSACSHSRGDRPLLRRPAGPQRRLVRRRHRAGMTGFVGANGAGKTTTMRIILGVLAADSRDRDARRRPVTAGDRQRFGYMPEERGLYPKMNVVDQIVYLGRLHGLDATARGRRTLATCWNGSGSASGPTTRSRRCRLGNQQRAQIAAALVHDPVVLVLDEPFSGLDPMAVEIVRRRAARTARLGGAPVLFSSHQLDVVERLCDDLVIIADGRDPRQRQPRGEPCASTPRRQLRLLVSDADAGWVRDAARRRRRRVRRRPRSLRRLRRRHGRRRAAAAVDRGTCAPSAPSSRPLPRSSRRSSDEHHPDRDGTTITTPMEHLVQQSRRHRGRARDHGAAAQQGVPHLHADLLRRRARLIRRQRFHGRRPVRRTTTVAAVPEAAEAVGDAARRRGHAGGHGGPGPRSRRRRNSMRQA